MNATTTPIHANGCQCRRCQPTPIATPATDRLMGTVHARHCQCRRCVR